MNCLAWWQVPLLTELCCLYCQALNIAYKKLLLRLWVVFKFRIYSISYMANLITIKNAEVLSTIHNIHRSLGNPCSRDSQSLAHDLGNSLSSLPQEIIVKE